MTTEDQGLALKPLRRILFVSRHYSSDFSVRVAGVYQRMRMMLEACAQCADAIDILFFVDERILAEVGPLPAQQSIMAGWNIATNVTLAPRAVRTRGRVARALSSAMDFRTNEDFFPFNGDRQIEATRAMIKPDTNLIFGFRVHPAAAVVKALASHREPPPVVIDIDDVEQRTQPRMWSRRPFSVSKLLRFVEYPALVRGELSLITASRCAFVCSDDDRLYLRKRGMLNIEVIPNSVRFPATEPKAEVAPLQTLFFIGTYTYLPNREAVEFLVNHVFPLVRDKVPGVRVTIAGENCEQLSKDLHERSGVDMVGFVADLDAAYRAATVVCCPILVGGGTRVKIIEAATRKRPVVSTTIGAEGLVFRDEVEILLRDTPADFADACVRLLSDPVAAASLGENAYRRAQKEYDRNQIIERISACLTNGKTSPRDR